jgi:exodeoxyribonuclease-3
MRIIGWNIRAGGGRRIEQIATQLWGWQPDIVALSEYRGTPPSEWLAETLAELGLPHQATTASASRPARNALLVASRWPTSVIPLRSLPHPRERILPVHVEAPVPISILAVHGPLGPTGLRRPFNSTLLAKLRTWKRAPGMLIGDTNTGKRGIDEESPVFDARDDAWMDGMAEAGWPDSFRHVHGDRREYTWYSPNRGNGFRLDEAFVHRSVLPKVTSVEYRWAPDATGRRDGVSDHAAIIVDLAE